MMITVVGSINLDFVARAPHLPAPGETVTGAVLSRHPGGKGANQALAAEKLGAEVCLIGRVGNDALAGEALAMMEPYGVDLSEVEVDVAAPTGVALITVDGSGENQITVAAGANHMVTPEQLPQRIEGALIVQLELPIETVEAAVGRATGFVCANLARKLDLDPEACLRGANAKFERRFQAVEGKLARQGQSPADVSLDVMEAAWQAVKKEEAAG